MSTKTAKKSKAKPKNSTQAKDTALKALLDSPSPIQLPEPGELQKLLAREMVLQETIDGLYSFEKEALYKVHDELKSVKEKLKPYKNHKEFGKIARKYPMINLEPLTWRHNNGTPVLAIIDEDGMMKVGTEVQKIQDRWDGKTRTFRTSIIEPIMPATLRELYKDVLKATRQMTIKGEKKSHFFMHQPSFIVPREVKQKAEAAEQDFDSLFFITETKEDDWTLATEKPKVITIDADPLLVGCFKGNLWLIDMFDPTPLEEYIAAEFSVIQD